MRKRLHLTDDALLAILGKEEAAARHYQWSALGKTREEALAYYDREPYGDEQEGGSQVVTSEFADVIESIIPGLMRVFTSTDEAAEFAPAAPGEEPWAREASEYVPHVVMRQNEGFRILYWLIKDALMYRLGAVTVDLEDFSDTRRLQVQALPQDALDLIAAQAEGEGAELALDLEQDPTPTPDTDGIALPLPPAPPFDFKPTFFGTITVTTKRKRVVVDNIAPEDILFTPTARDQVGDSERPLWLVVAYVRADENGDGVSELLRVVYAHAGGTAGRILEHVEWEGPASIVLASP